MSIRAHIRIFLIATIVWLLFLVAGMPDYYLQYSDQSMIYFVLLLLLPFSIILVVIFRKINREKRLKIALWYAFYFTVPLLIYDSIYCGIILRYGIGFITVFWYLSVYYIIPWILFPFIALLVNRLQENGN